MIKKVLEGERQVPVKVWTEDIGVNTEIQLRQTAQLPFVYRHVAAMPDVHLGMGATVGSVVATVGAVIPAAVGVDIGCGMLAVKTNLREGHLDDKLPAVRQAIESRVPVGHNCHSHDMPWSGFNTPLFADVKDRLGRAKTQLGTLGGGNHFIEICLDKSGAVWIMLHSGSRNIGKVIADEHIKNAQALMELEHVELPNKDLAFLVHTSPGFNEYMSDIQWAQAYARENREQMLIAVLEGMRRAGLNITPQGQVINCHHNYIAKEEHYGMPVLVTRKGAIRARVGDMGIIPGSMGARSYIVRGLGCEESFCSAPHGAGRRLSRTEAKKRYTVADVEEQTKGVECRKDAGVIDEIPSAYKPIDEVMANSIDLVEIVEELRQIVCIKG